MKYKWLNKQKNNELIVFFNGWGMDDSVVKHLEFEDYDVIIFYDYNFLEIDFDFSQFSSYKAINLIAWSMGVMVGSIFASKIPNLKKTVAINGTLKPIDVNFGIHPRIYDLTIKGFNENGKEKFIRSMFDGDFDNTKFKNDRQLEEQLSELIALKNYSSVEDFKYEKVLISNNDKIIPTKSQVKFWNLEPNCNSGHCPFFNFKKWSEIL